MIDCRGALALLDALRPDSDDLQDSEFAAVLEHAESCPRCLATMRRRQNLDRRISAVLNDVAVPEDLEARTLQLLSKTTTSRRAVPVNEHPQRPARRRTVAFCAVASVLLVLGMGIWGYVVRTSTRLTIDSILAELQGIKSSDWRELDSFHGDSTLKTLPSDAWSNGPIWTLPNPLGLPRDATMHTMALYSFQARLRPNELTQGLLVVVSRWNLSGSPIPEGMAGAPIYYVATGGRNYSVTVWTAGEFVYVCGVEGGADSLESLQRVLEGYSA